MNSRLPNYLILNKEIGETPLEVLDEFKKNNHRYAAVPMAYAGRLDPLASGTLLILVGEECKKQKKYMGMDKEYEFEVLLGLETDTFDVLGIASKKDSMPESEPTSARLEAVLATLRGKQSFPYPAFSSKTVKGKSLFLWALEGKINEIEIPAKDVNVFELEHVSTKTINADNLFAEMSDKIESIKPVTQHTKALGNDFRRPEIRKRYAELREATSSDQDFYILKFRCVCSSGTYMRTLAHMIGGALGYSSLAYSIHRTKVGSFKKFGPIKFWSKQY